VACCKNCSGSTQERLALFRGGEPFLAAGRWPLAAWQLALVYPARQSSWMRVAPSRPCAAWSGFWQASEIMVALSVKGRAASGKT